VLVVITFSPLASAFSSMLVLPVSFPKTIAILLVAVVVRFFCFSRRFIAIFSVTSFSLVLLFYLSVFAFYSLVCILFPPHVLAWVVLSLRFFTRCFIRSLFIYLVLFVFSSRLLFFGISFCFKFVTDLF
jgi:hypothetical protein